MKAKTVRDGQSHTHSEVRYVGVCRACNHSDSVVLESLRHERACTRAHQSPRTNTLVEFAELSRQGEVAIGYFTCTAKSGGSHKGQGAFPHVGYKLMYGCLQILKTVYLPEETSAWLAESSKSQKPAGNHKVSFEDCELVESV